MRELWHPCEKAQPLPVVREHRDILVAVLPVDGECTDVGCHVLGVIEQALEQGEAVRVLYTNVAELVGPCYWDERAARCAECCEGGFVVAYVVDDVLPGLYWKYDRVLRFSVSSAWLKI